MKNFKILDTSIIIVVACLILQSGKVFSQTYVTWDVPISPGSTSGISGTYPGGSVSITPVGTGSNVNFMSAFSTLNLVVTGANTFRTRGPGILFPSMNLNFAFTTPVRITRFNVADIDKGFGWDDSFDFVDIAFTNFISVHCNPTSTGVSTISDIGVNVEFVSWFASTTVSSQFGINFRTTDDVTHSFLAYSIEVERIATFSEISPLCFASVPPLLPPNDLHGVTGTWTPANINTSIAGTTTYSFTPDSDQNTTIIVPLQITILPQNDPSCCPVSISLSSADDVFSGTSNREAQETIFASNVISTNATAIYHGANFVELNPGFEAMTQSKFAAYIAGCDGSAIYRYKNSDKNMVEEREPAGFLAEDVSQLLIYPNPSTGLFNVSVINNKIRRIQVFSIDGKKVMDNDVNDETYLIDAGNFIPGIYIINVLSDQGTFIDKFIKK